MVAALARRLLWPLRAPAYGIATGMIWLLILLGFVTWLNFFGPCPTPTPPAGLIGEISQVWNCVLFFACAFYATIKSFSAWAVALPVLFTLIFLPLALLNGSLGHALFLLISLAFSMIYGVAFSFARLLIEGERGAGCLTYAILLVYSFALSAVSIGNATEFAASFC